MEVLKGLKLLSPLGPITIDPETSDIVQNVYVREAKKVRDKVYSIEFASIEKMKDSGKELLLKRCEPGIHSFGSQQKSPQAP